MKPTQSTERRGAARSGFTLVELLIVILILGIVATIALLALLGAQEMAKEARTKAQIARIESLLGPVWDAYRTRRVRVHLTAAERRDQRAAAMKRLNGLRELMRMELPDRKTDVVDNPVVLPTRPQLSQEYQLFVNQRAGGFEQWSATFQQAECLYMILYHLRDGDARGTDFFREFEIGDVDGDGMPEILDGWGNPIRLLRWAPGFRSPRQDGDPVNSPDPFDPLRVHTERYGQETFLLYPLVVSAGPDGQYDLVMDSSSGMRYSQTDPPNNPFMILPNDGKQIGMPVDELQDGPGHLDNITNHWLTAGG